MKERKEEEDKEEERGRTGVRELSGRKGRDEGGQRRQEEGTREVEKGVRGLRGMEWEEKGGREGEGGFCV